MDSISGLLDGPRARDAFVLRSCLDPPWSVRILDEAPLTLVTLVRGHAWVVPDTGDAVRLDAGDVAVVRGPDYYTLCDEPDRAPQALIHPGQRCTTVHGTELTFLTASGVRSWGNTAEGATVMVTGTYQSPGEVSRRLQTGLPPLLVLRRDDGDDPLVGYLAREVVRDDPGQEAVLDRLLDLVLIAALRAWFARPQAGPGWYHAHGDPVVGPALRALQHRPEQPWTVARLASTVGVSRATLARRFTELVGEPPMRFLTTWRLTLAADLLREPDATVGSVATKVGYGTPFALSAAFKRARGVSPREHRARSGPPRTV